MKTARVVGRTGKRALLGAALALLLAAPAAIVAAGCGGEGGGPTGSPSPSTPPPTSSPTTSPSPSPTSAATTTVSVYFLRNGFIGTAHRTLPATTMPATAALRALLQGPTAEESAAGLNTAIPADYELQRVAIKDGTAFVDLSCITLYEFTAKGARRLLAQIVYTVTQFPTVDGAVVTLNGEQLRPPGSAGPLDRLITRADFEAVTPAIFVELPAVGDAVSRPLTVSGTANTFEATFITEVLDADGAVLKKEVVTATSGSGTRGAFSTELKFPLRGATVTLVVYEVSMEDGSRLHEVRIPLHVIVY